MNPSGQHDAEQDLDQLDTAEATEEQIYDGDDSGLVFEELTDARNDDLNRNSEIIRPDGFEEAESDSEEAVSDTESTEFEIGVTRRLSQLQCEDIPRPRDKRTDLIGLKIGSSPLKRARSESVDDVSGNDKQRTKRQLREPVSKVRKCTGAGAFTIDEISGHGRSSSPYSGGEMANAAQGDDTDVEMTV